ncbi:MAG: hypothetical protein IKK11_03300 [Oscillospiraceae bacterium]|nr:hypothetical protein [Oscillospiraceae bacterium]
MYQDAKEELQRLQEALLEEEAKTPDTDPADWDLEEALSDIPDLPAPKKKPTPLLLIAIPVWTALAAIALLVWILYTKGWIG